MDLVCGRVLFFVRPAGQESIETPVRYPNSVRELSTYKKTIFIPSPQYSACGLCSITEQWWQAPDKVAHTLI